MSHKNELIEISGQLARLHGKVTALLVGTPTEALNWRPCPGANSIYSQVIHILGSEQYLIATLVGGQNIVRDRESEFHAAGHDRDQLFLEIARVGTLSQEIIHDLAMRTDDVLSNTVMTTTGRHNLWYCLHFAIEHTALHLGHMELTVQMWKYLHSQGQVG